MTLFDKLENKINHRKDAPEKNKNLNTYIWGDLSYDEKQAYHIYEAFQKQTNKRGDKNVWLPSIYSKFNPDPDRDDLRPGDIIRQSKNWSYFVECWDKYKEDENFDINNFIDSVFRNLNKSEKIFPAQLKTKKVYEQYHDYRMKLKMTKTISTEKKMMQDIANTFKFMRNRIGDCEYSTIWSWFHDVKNGQYISDGVLCAIQEMISPFYFTISKSFIKAYHQLDKDIQDEILDGQEFVHIQVLVKIKSPVYVFAKELFGDDII